MNGNHDDARNQAARTVLAALALYAFALLRDQGYWLRSRCELIPQSEGEGCPAVLELINIDGTTDKSVIPNAEDARKLLKEACEAARKAFAESEKESKNGAARTATQSSEAVEQQRNTGGEAARLPNPGWEQRVIRLTPTENLRELVRRSDALTADTGTAEQEAPSAGNPS